MSNLRLTYSDLCEIVPIITHSSSTPLIAADLNPAILKLLQKVPDSYVYAIGGHSVIIWISEQLVAKVSLRAGCEHLRWEQNVLESFQHMPCEYIVQTFLSRPDIVFMQPLMDGTLLERIARGSQPPSIFPWMARITKAAAYLEKHGYAHGDINPRNIIFNAEEEPVLTDFDHALLVGQPLDVGEEPYVRCCAEESSGQYGTAGAITEQFALGSIFWLMQTKEELYDKIPGNERVDCLIDRRFPDTTEFGSVGDIISKCWRGEFASIAQLSQHIAKAMMFDDNYQERRRESEECYQYIVG